MTNTVEHHAQLFRGRTLEAAGLSLSALEQKMEVHLYQLPQVMIDDVRGMVTRAHRTPQQHNLQCIVIEAGGIAFEAQHALLKVLEEPPTKTIFYLVLPPEARLLPTILSRCFAVTTSGTESAVTEEFMTFIQATVPERLAVIAQAAKKKDLNWYKKMQNGLYTWLEREAVRESKVAQLAGYLELRGASKKMIWEALALWLPVAQ